MSMVEIRDPEVFFKEREDDLFFYVGFIRVSDEWVPLCHVKDAEVGSRFDTLFVAPAYSPMKSLVEEAASKVNGIQEVFVQYLLAEEVRNLLKMYKLSWIAEIVQDDHGCDCGCGCG